MALALYYETFGTGTPVLLLHGLFGSWDNLGSLGRSLSQSYQVIAADQRDHGRSPHSTIIDYPHLADDALALIGQLNTPVHIIGHSMGGKTAMQIALSAPKLVRSLSVIDIAPRRYERGHDRIFAGLHALDLEQIQSRRDADQKLSAFIDDASVRSFILKNLKLGSAGWYWRMNLAQLTQDYPKLIDWPMHDSHYNGPVLLLRGANSDYVSVDDSENFRRLFPNIQAKSIGGAGHWPHAEKPAVTLKLIEDFLHRA